MNELCQNTNTQNETQLNGNAFVKVDENCKWMKVLTFFSRDVWISICCWLWPTSWNWLCYFYDMNYWYDDEILAITCFVCHNLLRQRLLGVPFVKRLPFPNRNIPSKHSQTQRNVEGMSEQKAYTEIRFVYSINQRKLQFLKRCNSEGQNISYM